jgi:hypothetical protein
MAVNTLETALNVLLLTLVADILPSFLSDGSFSAKFISSLMGPDAELSSNKAREKQRYFHQIRERTWGRTVLLTEKGMLGLGPKDSQPGDHIYVTQNCSTPIVLRKFSDGYFTWIGDAYIHKLNIAEEMGARRENTAVDITIR